MSDSHYDVIVVRLGAIGSAASYHLAPTDKSTIDISEYGSER